MLVGSARSRGSQPTVVSPRAMLPKKRRTKRSETPTARTVTAAMTRNGSPVATRPMRAETGVSTKPVSFSE